jgi:DNA-3-methyladenine glycosylase
MYVYFVYGMHFCANIVALHEGVCGAVLLRAGEVVEGLDLARIRRPASRSDTELAKGPAKLTGVLGIDRTQNGLDLTAEDSAIKIYASDSVEKIYSGPRVGVAVAMDVPWRYWIDSPSVSVYRRGGKRTRQPS